MKDSLKNDCRIHRTACPKIWVNDKTALFSESLTLDRTRHDCPSFDSIPTFFGIITRISYINTDSACSWVLITAALNRKCPWLSQALGFEDCEHECRRKRLDYQSRLADKTKDLKRLCSTCFLPIHSCYCIFLFAFFWGCRSNRKLWNMKHVAALQDPR